MTRKVAIFIVLLVLSSAAALAQGQVFYVAQYAHGGAQFPIVTTITLVNLGTGILNPARVTVETFGEDGQPANLIGLQTLDGLEAVNTAQYEIQGRGAVVINSFSDDPGVAQEGYARISTDDDIAVEALFSLYDTNSNLLTTTSVLPRPAADEGTLLLEVDGANQVAGNIAIVNPRNSAGPATLNATLRDAFGNDMGSVEIGPIAVGSKVAQIWTENFTDLAGANGFVGSIEWTSNVPVIALPLLQTGIELTTQDPLPAR